MRKIIHDCDNTFGIQGCDVDDGLALLYLLGEDEAEVLGITTTYGNNRVECVFPNTLQMLKDIGRCDIPVFMGGKAKGDYESDASSFLAEMAQKYEGELELLVTGSTTNLYGAWLRDPDFFKRLKSIVMMGGITSPLIFKKKTMKELNFSCDPKATFKVLTSEAPVSVITGNNCLKALFTRQEYEERFQAGRNALAKFIFDKTNYWFKDNEDVYGIQGFYNWDTVAAAYMMHPEQFVQVEKELLLSEQDLEEGFLRESGGSETCNSVINMPQIRDEDGFRDGVYKNWIG